MRVIHRTFAAAAALALAAASSACEARSETVAGIFRTGATLSDITLSAGTLAPTFSPSITTYSSAVNNLTDQITVTPTAGSANSTITVNNSPVASGTPSQPITLFVGGNNNIDIVVTGADGLSTRTYVITVSRSAF
jgi:hypothetical protein